MEVTESTAMIGNARKTFLERNAEIVANIKILMSKNGWTERDLSKRLAKEEEEVGKWLSGFYDFTLSTITEIEQLLGERVL